jgi:transposase InsO family protein
LKKFGMRSSMSRKGACGDNAVAERFFHALKVQAVHGEAFATRDEIRKTVFAYVEIYYPRERLHSATGPRSNLSSARLHGRVSVLGGEDQASSLP